MITLELKKEKMQKRIKELRENVTKWMEKDMRLAAKRTAFYYMEYTTPVSTAANQWPMNPLKERIRSDVKKVYPSKSDPGWEYSAFLLLKANYNEETANKFIHAVLSRSQENFDPETGGGRNTSDVLWEKLHESGRSKIKKKPDLPAYMAIRKTHSIRKKKALQLDRKAPPDGFLAESNREAFIKRRQETAGLAKAGWYAADTALGGSRNFTRATNEEGRFVWPKECRKLVNKFGRGIGTGFVKVTEGHGHFEVINSVRYIWEALPDHLRELAEKRAKKAMQIVFDLRFKNIKKA